MTVTNTKPTLFGPAKTRPGGDKTSHQPEAWQALFIPFKDSLASPPLSEPITNFKKPHRVKRRQGANKSAATTAERMNHSRQTLYDYLCKHFLSQPVSIFTESGRVQGKVIEVTPETVHLETAEGMRAIDLHAIFSVAHKLPSH